MLTVHFFTFSPVQENTYVVFNDNKEAIIFDPGCYFPEERKQLATYIEQHDLRIVQLINTHCHLDHIFGNKWVAENYGLELFIHPDEEVVMQHGPQYGQMWGLPFDNYEGQLHFLHEGQTVTLGEDELRIILAPGHSPGSLCFYNEKQKFLIGGDVLFRDSIGRTDLPGGDHQTLLQSIREKLFVLPDDVVVYPGHGPSTTIGYEKQHNPFL
ncbi:MBL fold metallo-hydrolase [Aridibaculum aurantiacum]|uniref:MBL fold metallo-hydrolase n=1 Tax=Aridibaculum aurantiacum TaxID=2810307 RepID=UPI001A96B638|nr:MBL fold metallo-hydrolase [Aridibaculum aurantiacum]